MLQGFSRLKLWVKISVLQILHYRTSIYKLGFHIWAGLVDWMSTNFQGLIFAAFVWPMYSP